MTIHTQVLIQLPTHHAHVTVHDSGVISVFKYSDRNCDWDLFPPSDSFAASDYIVTPLPATYMRVVVDGDPSTVGPI
jgi:hypothetical protein